MKSEIPMAATKGETLQNNFYASGNMEKENFIILMYLQDAGYS